MSASSKVTPRRLAAVIVAVVTLLLAALQASSAAESGRRAAPHASLGTALRGAAPVGNGPSTLAIDRGTHTAYVANGNNANGGSVLGNTVSVIDTSRCNADDPRTCHGPWPTVTVGNEPSAVAVDRRTHTVYVANVDDNTVSVINGRTCNGHVVSGCDQTPATVPVGALPLGVFVDPRTRSVYVENFDDDTVSVLDASTCNGTHQAGCPASPLPTFGVDDGPGDLDVNQKTHTGYVATVPGLSVFDTRTCNATTRSGCDHLGHFPICQGCLGPWSARVDVAHNTIYAGDGESMIAAVDGRSCNADDLSGCATAPFGKVTLPDPGFDHILFLALDARRHTVYAVRQKDDAIVGFDTDACNGHRRAACSKVKRLFVHVGSNPQGIALDPGMHTLYVGNQVDDTVSLVDTRRCTADTTSGCRHRPPTTHAAPNGGIVVDPATDTAYVTTRHNTVAMVDTRSCRAFHTNGCHRHWPTVPVGHGPVALGLDRRTHTLYVANHGDSGTTGSVTVLDTRACHARRSGCSATTTIGIPAGAPTSIAVNRTTHAAYVGGVTPDGANTVSMIDGAVCNAGTTSGCGVDPAVMQDGPTRGPAIHCGVWYAGVAVNPVTNTVYATSTEGCGGIGEEVFVFDGATCGATDTSGCGMPTATVEAGSNPYDLTVDRATNTVYAALLADGEDHGRVAVIDGTTCNGTTTSGCRQHPATARAGFGSIAVAFDDESRFLYIANIEDMSVAVIDGRRCNGTRTSGCHTRPHYLPVDDYPDGIAVAPSIHTAYVTSGTRGTVSVVPIRQRD